MDNFDFPFRDLTVSLSDFINLYFSIISSLLCCSVVLSFHNNISSIKYDYISIAGDIF